jgi:hypothetical protein
MEECVFFYSSTGVAMVNQVGSALVGERAPRLRLVASNSEIVGLSATGDRVGAFTFFLPDVGAGLVARIGTGGDARGAGGGIAGGGVARGELLEEEMLEVESLEVEWLGEEQWVEEWPKEKRREAES